MKRVSLRSRRALNAFAWQSLGFAIVFVLLAFDIYRVETNRDRLTVIEQVKPIDLLRECLRTPKCRRLFRHPELLRPERPERGDAPQPPSTGGQPPEPGVRPGGRQRERSGGTQTGTKTRPKSPRPQPDAVSSPPSTDTAPDTAPSSAPPAEAPGKSDETRGAEKGNGAVCVGLIVSACVDRDVPLVP